MKTKTLLILTLLNVSAFAQSYLPAVFEQPITGFELLKAENPFILQQTRTISNSAWLNEKLYIKKNAPNVNYIGIDKIASWQNAGWSDLEATTDSFVLDNNNRIVTCFELTKYNYPGFNYQSKSKYIYSYDQANRLQKVIFQNANPVTSSVYTNTYSYTLNYNSAGIRTYDSLYSFADNITYLRGYVYNSNGKLIQELGIQEMDTVNNIIYEYDGDLLKNEITYSLDLTANEWSIENADTFEYNSNKLVSKKISWTTYYLNGSSNFSPNIYETYSYSSANKLTEILSKQFVNGTWKNQSKIAIEYNPQNNATVAYGFMSLNDAEWKPDAEQKYIFDETTSVVKNIAGIEKNISIFPNPANQELNISSNEIKSIVIFDITGKLVLENNTTSTKIDVSNLNEGIYTVQLFNHEGIKIGVYKLVINH